MRKLIALEPEVYAKLKHQTPDKKLLLELDLKMQEILNSNRPNSEKIIAGKIKNSFEKVSTENAGKKPLSENAVLKFLG